MRSSSSNSDLHLPSEMEILNAMSTTSTPKTTTSSSISSISSIPPGEIYRRTNDKINNGSKG